ncbi:F-box domain-containing protein [Mycena indigotica]|uniref:F-box domain-containing protein n=1 Tax=Mycena indigotica TaxID=2126181 RepID=A0A8H6SAW6_9AGAR|nr:F-box domain-containing protein [Mycena indigotica]KAF7295553.1 F-box domain-containing protein [Mycena indigotica]
MALPDEIISEILSPALKVQDDEFSSVSVVSPFAKNVGGESSSALLLVCKDWLRVSTPLLYHVVVLRSKAQAKALAETLEKNNDLARFIRKLRVEGGYGAPMQEILRAALNISELFISFNIFATDSTDGMCAGLRFINPKRLIICNASMKKANKMVVKLQDALGKAIRKWSNLAIFELSCGYYTRGDDEQRSIISALASRKQITTVVVYSPSVAIMLYKKLKGQALKTIIMNISADSLARHASEFEKAKSTIKEVAFKIHSENSCLESPRALDITPRPSLNPYYIPMASVAPAIRNHLWSHIIEFVFLEPHVKALHLLRVSKTFYQLTLPHHYRILSPRRYQKLSKLAATITANPTLASYVRNLDLRRLRDVWASSKNPILSLDTYVGAIIGATTGLRRLTMHGADCEALDRPYIRDAIDAPALYWKEFLLLADTAGASLIHLGVDMSMDEGAPIESGVIFNKFSVLQHLGWRSRVVFAELDSSVEADSVDTPRKIALPCLSELAVWEADESFYAMLAEMELPALEKFTLIAGSPFSLFWINHGAKLTTVDIHFDFFDVIAPTTSIVDLCPNLVALTIAWRLTLSADLRSVQAFPPSPKVFKTDQPTFLLRHLKFLLHHSIGRKDVYLKWEEFFATFATDVHPSIPGLEEIKITGFKWPNTEREIQKSAWVRCAQSLFVAGLTKVRMLDEEGQVWRQRLGQ